MPSESWLRNYEKFKENTISPVNLNDYFTKPEISGIKIQTMQIGTCSVPSGELIVCDPLVFLGMPDLPAYFQKVPAGNYQTEICVIPKNLDCARYAAVRIRFTQEEAISFYEALTGSEELDTLEEGEYFGFPVDAGLACICDKVLHQAFCDFVQKWEKQNPDGNLYDDYFSALLEQNYQAHPEHQRQDGDWLNWNIPETEYFMPIFQSGFGDGVYPVYFGYDKNGDICQLIIHLIDIALAYGEDEE